MILSPVVVMSKTPRSDRHALKGTVAIEGVPRVRRVGLFDRRNFQVITSTLSDENGNWSIEGIREFEEKELFVIAFDDVDGVHNAKIFDFVSQYAPNPPVLEEAVGGE